MLRGLVAEGIEFVVIGGVAAVAHGSPSTTNDLDICYHASASNIRRLAELLQRWKAYPRDWEPGRPFALDARTLKTTPTWNLRTVEGDLDVLSGVVGLDGYRTARRESTMLSAFGITFPALNLAALIKSKEALGRPKDQAHLLQLRALLELSRAPSDQ